MPFYVLLALLLIAPAASAVDRAAPVVLEEPTAPPPGLDNILTETLGNGAAAKTAVRTPPAPAAPVAAPAATAAATALPRKTGIETADLPPVTPETPDITIAAPIPADAIDTEHLTRTVKGAMQKAPAPDATAPDVSSAPVIMRGPTTLAPPPVPAALSRYQFLPLLAKGAAPDALPLLWPVLSSRPLAGDHGLISRVVIVVHDAARDAAETLRSVAAIAGPNASGPRANTLIIAPQFPAKPDRALFKPLLTDATNHVAVWEAEGWWQGADTPAGENRQRQISSMTALDMLLLMLGDTRIYPELRSIIIAGYGRGADLVHRYALYGRAPDVLARQHLQVQYVVAEAQSYVYLTDARPGAVPGSFAPPKDSKACASYQNYPYGLEEPNAYTRLTAGNVARQNYPGRQVTYLVGGAGGMALDQSCAAALQGKTVKDRAVNYDAYLKSNFGEMPKQRLLVMPGVGDDALALLLSGCGASLLFSDGECLRAEEGRR